MNEIIKELMKHAGTDTSGKWMGVEHAEKFTELIVQECADVLLKWKGEPFPFDENLAASLIKEHFGVES
jgi:hypothetical protein